MLIINLKDFALKALETAKEDLRRDKYLLPVAFIVTDLEVFDYTLDFEGVEQKVSVYSEIVEIAKQKGASAIITLNDANVTTGPQAITQGSANKDIGAKRIKHCVYLTVSGPAIQTWSICLPYERNGDEITFGNPDETVNDFLNLLPGWPANQKTVS